MQSKRMIWLLAIIGGWLGGYVPTIWGAGYFSFASILFSALGSILGIWVAFAMTR
jgi:uncharacterized membrane protein YeaQ/YmgE (transglycosylase-associated protein family)